MWGWLKEQGGQDKTASLGLEACPCINVHISDRWCHAHAIHQPNEVIWRLMYNVPSKPCMKANMDAIGYQTCFSVTFYLKLTSTTVKCNWVVTIYLVWGTCTEHKHTGNAKVISVFHNDIHSKCVFRVDQPECFTVKWKMKPMWVQYLKRNATDQWLQSEWVQPGQWNWMFCQVNVYKIVGVLHSQNNSICFSLKKDCPNT